MEVQRFNQSFDELVAILNSGYPQKAGYAAQALGELGDKRAIEPLLEMLTPAKIAHIHASDVTEALAKLADESIVEPLWDVVLNPALHEIVRRMASVPLAAAGPRGQTLLFAGLQHADNGVRQAVLGGLSKIGSNTAIKAIDRALYIESDNTIRLTAIRGLGYSGNPQAIPPLVKVANNTLDSLRPEAIAMLGRTNNPAAIPALAQILLTDKNRETRILAAEALSYLKFEQATQPLLKGLLEDSYSMVRDTCANGLLNHTDEPIARELLFALHDPVSNVRSRVASLLWLTNDPQVIRPLLEVAQNEAEKPHVRENAIYALGRLKAPAAKDYLLSLLTHKSNKLRALAAGALGLMGELEAFEPLVKTLTDRFPQVREQAIRALATLKHPDTVNVLLARLALEPEAYLHNNLIVALGKLGDKRAVEPLLEELARNSTNQRYVVVALGALGDSRASDTIAEFIHAQNPELRQVAVCALAKLGDARGIDVLVHQLRDYNYNTRYWTIEVLAELGEKALPALPTLDWLSQHDRNDHHVEEGTLSIRQAAAAAMEKILASLNNTQAS